MSEPFAPVNFGGRRLAIFGAGYVGGALARAAMEQGLAVTALTRNPEKALKLERMDVRAVVAELAMDNWHEHPALAEGADLVVNCVSAGGGGEEGYRRSYVEGWRSILGWASARAVGTMVYTSSTSVYPQGDGAIVTEESATANAFGRPGLLLEAEGLARSWPGRWFVLRLAGIYGPGRHHLLDQLRTGVTELPGLGGHRLNLAHRDDIVTAIQAALAAPERVASGVFNVADDEPATKAEVVGWLAARLGRAVPEFNGEPAGGRRAVVPDRLIDNGRLKRVLGWAPSRRNFREGYADLLGA